ncbi:MAG: ATP synthase, Delta/Epsilon chain, beta-sandwich domain-containing protein [Candidatus Woesebacteria bacterium GW2011_GWA2_40_7]|uniref:ATP synthase, Delta/Epsilon chain, beta-sandwich domain-containing protein n=3 Tax=Candidatus Woeseibacteriota TaxID=1752722 RepID=A0A0G0X3U4_9BACT|nr:MAG: ATP synthase, Delta/Epsilon chain, beta-sandwich domain-containing protein [Candidatus Woesebacteria bacterium GW2011_GWB1_39_10]KKR73542.1 MAG: ATP synthase, Delta/Epsilon chain, beta-sandwich domain-containing protein [Candidatus Woesebacteria bacterium GW2011_GWA2_40_7]KKR91345.1 MAG: ATP synthase, Delta/Epsilon chain, beta-sandwich domain-containing protein [Candidatus Woesebacteria bacterium GW2011_GWA1_41_13b]
MPNSINVTIRKRDGVVFEGDAYAVSSTNEMGPFDILAMHANFVSTIKEKVIITGSGGKKTEFKIEYGIISAKADVIEVFLGV